MKILYFLVPSVSNIQCYAILNNFTYNEELEMPEMCDGQDVYWENIQYRADEKLGQITEFMRRRDVITSVQREMEENLNRVKRDGYHDDHDDHDDNVVVRCKHGYTGVLIQSKSFSISFYL